MLFLVNEEIKSLTAIGKNNVEWTQDLLGEHNASYSYDEDKGMYTMSADDYEWWSDIVDKLNQIEDMERELTSEELEEYYSESFAGDLESITEAQFNWLSEKKEAKEVLAELGIENEVFNFSLVSFDGNEPFVLNGRFYDETDIEATEQFSEYIKGKDYSHWLTGKEFAKASVKIEEYAIGGTYSEPNDAFEARNATLEEVAYISNHMDKVLKCAKLQNAQEIECRDYRDTEKKPSVLGEIGKIKAEQKAQEAEKPAPQKAKSNNQEL